MDVGRDAAHAPDGSGCPVDECGPRTSSACAVYRSGCEVRALVLSDQALETGECANLELCRGRLGLDVHELAGLERVRYVLARRAGWHLPLLDLDELRDCEDSVFGKALLDLHTERVKHGGDLLARQLGLLRDRSEDLGLRRGLGHRCPFRQARPGRFETVAR